MRAVSPGSGKSGHVSRLDKERPGERERERVDKTAGRSHSGWPATRGNEKEPNRKTSSRSKSRSGESHFSKSRSKSLSSALNRSLFSTDSSTDLKQNTSRAKLLSNKSCAPRSKQFLVKESRSRVAASVGPRLKPPKRDSTSVVEDKGSSREGSKGLPALGRNLPRNKASATPCAAPSSSGPSRPVSLRPATAQSSSSRPAPSPPTLPRPALKISKNTMPESTLPATTRSKIYSTRLATASISESSVSSTLCHDISTTTPSPESSTPAASASPKTPLSSSLGVSTILPSSLSTPSASSRLMRGTKSMYPRLLGRG